MKILIVEDDAATRTAMARILSGEGHEVIQALNARVAIAILGVEVPDLVFLDIILGNEEEMTGWTVAGYMQTTQRLRQVRIIVVSGLDVENIRAGAKTYGNTLSKAVLILGKPISAEDLLQAVATAKAK